MWDELENISFELAIGAITISSILVAAFGASSIAIQNLLTFFIIQFVVVAIFLIVRLRGGLLIGASVGLALVTIFETFWELRVYQGPNSMPFFVYIFLCLPSVLIGLTFFCIITISWSEQSARRSFYAGLIGSTWIFVFYVIGGTLWESFNKIVR